MLDFDFGSCLNCQEHLLPCNVTGLMVFSVVVSLFAWPKTFFENQSFSPSLISSCLSFFFRFQNSVLSCSLVVVVFLDLLMVAVGGGGLFFLLLLFFCYWFWPSFFRSHPGKPNQRKASS